MTKNRSDGLPKLKAILSQETSMKTTQQLESDSK